MRGRRYTGSFRCAVLGPQQTGRCSWNAPIRRLCKKVQPQTLVWHRQEETPNLAPLFAKYPFGPCYGGPQPGPSRPVDLPGQGGCGSLNEAGTQVGRPQFYL